MRDPQLVAVLEYAANYVEEHGLGKGAYFKGQDSEQMIHPLSVALALVATGDTPKCCTLGAIYMAVAQGHGISDGSRLALRAARAVTHVIPSCRADAEEDIPEWNDVTSRRKADVVRVLRAAADRYKEPIA